MSERTREPGRELDRDVAARVMGLEVCEIKHGSGPCDCHIVAAGSAEIIPFYSTDIAAAWQVMEKMQERGWDGMVRRVSDGYAVSFESMHGGLVASSVDPREGDAALAICLAALKATP